MSAPPDLRQKADRLKPAKRASGWSQAPKDRTVASIPWITWTSWGAGRLSSV